MFRMQVIKIQVHILRQKTAIIVVLFCENISQRNQQNNHHLFQLSTACSHAHQPLVA